MDFWQNIFDMIISPDLQRALFPLKLLFLCLSVFIVALIIFLLSKSSYLRYLCLDYWEDYSTWKRNYSLKAKKAARKRRREGEQELPTVEPRPEPEKGPVGGEINLKNGRVKRTDWERVLDKLESKDELNYKLALIDADKVFTQALEGKGRELSSDRVSNVGEVLKAREVIEKMLANPQAKLSRERAKELIEVYQKAYAQVEAI